MKILARTLACILTTATTLVMPAPGQLQMQLNADAVVRRETVRLSDLLPAAASETLRQAAAGIELGRAPQSGTQRDFTAAEIKHRLDGQPALLRQLAIPDHLTVRRVACEIRRDAVGNAVSGYLQAQGWPEDELPSVANLRWPEAVETLRENPALEVAGINWNEAQHTVEIRMRCADRSECGSFLVQAQAPRAMGAAWRSRATGASVSPVAGNQQLIKPLNRATAGPVLAHAGQPAMLIMESGNMRISVPVLCLERGRLRQQVRVRDRAGRRIYLAEVVGEGLLHASF